MCRLLVMCAAAFTITFANAAAAHANPELYECPETHAHVWDPGQCASITPGLPIGGGGGGGHCGLICGVRKILGGGLGGLL